MMFTEKNLYKSSVEMVRIIFTPTEIKTRNVYDIQEVYWTWNKMEFVYFQCHVSIKNQK